MSLPEFSTLLANHPAEDASAITALEQAIVSAVRRDRNVRFDLALVLHRLRAVNVTPSQAKRLLVELVRERALHQLLFWECPNGKGPIFESSDLSAFPDSLDCDRCGELHWFDGEDVEVGFIASDHLTEELAEPAT